MSIWAGKKIGSCTAGRCGGAEGSVASNLQLWVCLGPMLSARSRGSNFLTSLSNFCTDGIQVSSLRFLIELSRLSVQPFDLFKVESRLAAYMCP